MIEQVFSSAKIFLNIIAIHVSQVGGLPRELKDVVIQALVKVLDILRILTVAVNERTLGEYFPFVP